MNIKPVKLIQKSFGNIIKSGEKIHGSNGLSILPLANAKEYNLVEGIGAKGRFSTYNFKDSNGKSIQHYTRYIDDKGTVTDVVTDIDKTIGCINTARKTINVGKLDQEGNFIADGTVEKTDYNSIIANILEDKLFFSNSFVRLAKNGDMGGFEVLRRGKAPAGINYQYHWDGKPTQINHKNTKGRKLDLTESEQQYLPFIMRKSVITERDGQPALLYQDFSADRFEEKVQLSQIINERLHNIEGIAPKIKTVKAKDLHSIKTSEKSPEQWLTEKGFVPLAETLGNGQINVVNDIAELKDGVNILDIVSHEIQHLSDMIKMYLGGKEASNEALNRVGMTLEEYMKLHEKEFAGIDTKSFQTKLLDEFGQFKKGTPEYEESVEIAEMNFKTVVAKDLKSCEQHDEMGLEKRAINREFQQMTVLQNVAKKVGEFVCSLLKI
ncbi:hypothetical protein J6E39_03325 [bacterium]|nr:hypothetical protein [bacterium]